MRILLINPPKEHEFALFVLDDYNTKARSNNPPLGLMYLYSYMKDDHEIEILDMNAKEMKISDIGAEIDRFQPEIIGITCVIAKWFTVRELAKEIKKHTSDIPIVLGGINPSLYPQETLKCENIDYVITGFGQVPFKTLCAQIENKTYDYKEIVQGKIPNLYTFPMKPEGGFQFEDIDKFPFPDRSCLDINDYTMPFFPENPVTSMMTSLGCPYKCSFCACKNFQPVTFREPEKIVEEMKEIEALGIRSILFQDELFTMSTHRIKKICTLILHAGVKLTWSVRSRANLMNKEALELMKEAGCFNIHLGIESGVDRILSEMKKGLITEDIKKSVRLIQEVGLSCTASFMIGYPDETREEILQTIGFAKELGLNNCQFFITQPEPNTELYTEKYGSDSDIYRDFTLNPESVDLKNNLASNLFNRDQLIEFIKFGYSQVNNLYKIKG